MKLGRPQGTGLIKSVVEKLVPAALLLASACGGQMPFSGNLTVIGDPPPPPEPKAPARVEVRDNAIEIREKIQFELAKATIKEESFSLLNEIVQVIKDNPHIKKIRIEGHASSDGDATFNKRLSADRAKSVMTYLVDHGISKDALISEGYGVDRPIADNSSEEGREKNRRVEFNIIEQDVTKKKVSVTESGEEKVLETSTSTEGGSGLAKPKK